MSQFEYPPVPFTTEPHLLAVRCEANATVDVQLNGKRQMQHDISMLPRGGYRGGLVLWEWGFALGLVTHSLGKNGEPAELGHASVASVEAIYNCLAHHGIMPAVLKEGWDGLWD